jgi:hypothetical protein
MADWQRICLLFLPLWRGEQPRSFSHKAAAECICLFALLFKTASSPQSARVLTPNAAAVLEQTPSKPPLKEQSVTEFCYSILLSSFLLQSDATN